MTVLDTPLDTVRYCVAPFKSADQLQIHEELAYLLSTPQFTGSKRYPAFLKWVVEQTLAGNASDLKERTIGVELFGKSPDYDTSNDTIVRFTAGEVRKRLVLAYHQPGRHPSIRIGLPPGSYIPEFLQSEAMPEAFAIESEPAIPSSFQPALANEASKSTTVATPAVIRLRIWMIGMFILTVVASLLIVLIVQRVYAAKDDSALNRFWQPMQNSGSSVIIATGAVIPSQDSGFGLTPATSSDRYPYVSLASATAVAHIGGVLEKSRIAYAVQPSSRVTLPDMVQHPVILIGTFNNDWTLRLLANLRFGVTNKHEPGIVDTLNPGQVWRPLWSQGDGNHMRLNDYAIVARYHDKSTENTVVLVAGLEKNGTEAAAQFVTDRRYLDMLDRTQPRGWLSKNVEIVLRAKVVEGQSGAPEVVAVHTW